MPLYDLVCNSCSHEKEVFLKLYEIEPMCDKCGFRMHKTISTPAFILQGSGWAHDNYGLKKSKSKGDKVN